MIIVITHEGRTTEHEVEGSFSNEYTLRVAEEIRELSVGALSDFVIDRMATDGVDRVYVRPKVPFGSERIGDGPGILERTALQQATARGRLTAQLDIAVEALLQYSTSPTSGDRARQALEQIACLDEGGCSS